jgi:hypothetical protein
MLFLRSVLRLIVLTSSSIVIRTMEAIRSSEKSVLNKSHADKIPEDGILLTEIESNRKI